VLMLRATPHQFQVIGLYVVLLAIAPAMVLLIAAGRTTTLLAISWVLYFKSWAYPVNLIDAQFEYAFPILTWQLIFVHGLAFGYHRRAILTWLEGWRGLVLVAVGSVAFLAFLVLAQNNPNPFTPPWARLTWIDAETFYRIYNDYFTK